MIYRTNLTNILAIRAIFLTSNQVNGEQIQFDESKYNWNLNIENLISNTDWNEKEIMKTKKR
jgi:hypothetical protein